MPQRQIDKLTPAQEALLPVYRDMGLKLAFCTNPADRPRFEAALTAISIEAKLRPINKFTWVNDFHEARKVDPKITWNHVVMWGTQWDAGWWAWQKYYREVLKVDLKQPMLPHVEAAIESGSFWIVREPQKAICLERPIKITLDDQMRLHAENAPAFQFRSGRGIYVWHGVAVPEKVIMAPETMTVQEIDDEPNVELRRIMITKYGQDKYLVKGGAKKVQEDGFGILYEKPRKGDSPLKMVHVTNSTPEPDGTLKTYFLRIPPQIKSAQEAVAWSFGKEGPQDYNPDLQS